MSVECCQQISIVEYVDNMQQASTSFVSVDGYAEENKTKFICTHWKIRIM